jgi:hypothetical protein
MQPALAPAAFHNWPLDPSIEGDYNSFALFFVDSIFENKKIALANTRSRFYESTE